MNLPRPGRGLQVVVLVVLAVGVATAATSLAPGDLTYDRSADAPAPNPWINESSLTIDHHVGDGPLEYDDDNGDPATLPGTVNSSVDNPYRYQVTGVEDPDFGAFPRGSAQASALNASEWSTGGANASKLTVSDTETETDVDAVRFDTGSAMATDDVATATYNNWSTELDSDESKRVLMLAADVDTLDSDTRASVRVYDESGDYKEVAINGSSSATEDGTSTWINATGDGQVVQVKLSELTTEGGGSWSNVENVTVRVTDGDLDMSVSLVDLEKKTPYEWGTYRADTDGDDDLEDVDVAEDPDGDVKVHAVDTIDNGFSDATLHDLTVAGVQYRAQDLTDAEDYEIEVTEASDRPAYDQKIDFYYRLEVPSAIELSHSGLELRHSTAWPGERYAKVETREGCGTTDFEDVSGWTDQTASFDSEGKNVTVDDTISVDTAYCIHVQWYGTQEEVDAMQSAGGGGGGAAPSEGGNPIVSFFTDPLGAVVSLLGAIGIGGKALSRRGEEG